MKRFILIVLSLIVAASCCACGNNADSNSGGGNNSGKDIDLYSLDDWTFTLSQLIGQDNLNRKVTPATSGAKQKYVGVYFMPWFGDSVNNTYDISKLLELYEEGITGNPQNPLWAISGEFYDPDISPNGAFHYWNEPLFGYYSSADKWVIARQLELLAYAQVDFIMMDFTNGFVYDDATNNILSVIKEMTEGGCPVPKMAFMLPNNSMSESTLRKVVEKFISNKDYKNCFFVADEKMNPGGKPLVTADINAVTSTPLLDYVWAKQMFWSGSPKDETYFPAGDSNVSQFNFNGMMGVNVAINASWFSDCYLYPDATTVYGRGWTVDKPFEQGTEKQNVLKGTFFDYQWKKALDENVDLVFVSCWNEFAAQKQAQYRNDYQTAEKAVFVDTFSPAFSKDCEPVKGELGDNYYMQLLEKTREFKYDVCSSAAVNHEKNVVDLADISSWNKVPGNYLDIAGDARERNFRGAKNTVIYKDDTNRNDIVRTKIANDDENLYVMVETKEDITEYVPGDDGWMNLYLSTGSVDSWNGYGFIVNKTPGATQTTVSKYNNGKWENCGNADYRVSGNKIVFSIPLRSISVKPGATIGLKATDNVPFAEDVMNFYLGGDSAPMGRLNYAYCVA